MGQSTPELDGEAERARIATALLIGTDELVGDISPHELLTRFTGLLVETSDYMRLAWFYLGDPQARHIRPTYVAGPEAAYGRSLVVDRSRLVMKGPVRRALSSNEPAIQSVPARLNPLQRAIPGLDKWHRAALAANVGSVLALPFPLRERPETGLCVLYATPRDYFDQVGIEPFTAVARLIQVGLERFELKQRELDDEARIAHLSMYDGLTGLPNRVLFRDQLNARLGQAARTRTRFGLAVLDLDDFKDINDHFGLGSGDRVLVETGHRLRRVIGRRGVVARLGGDEFVVMFTDWKGETAFEAMLDMSLMAVSESVELTGQRVSVSASMGATVVDADADLDANEVMRRVDIALSEAKHGGGAVWRRFETPAADAPGAAAPDGRHRLIHDVRVALTEDQCFLTFQPQVYIAPANGAAVAGVEALLRWDHPSRGRIMPADFMPMVEQSHLIREVGRWILFHALEAVERWRRQGLDLLVAVNIGARHLLHPDFGTDLQAALARHPFPDRLEIEITESAALADLDRARRVLGECRRLGVGVALDDFGAGHSSLTYLEQLPVTRLKIDRRFVRDLDVQPKALAVISGTVISAHLLGIEVIGEGVERPDQGVMLARIGCDLVQGFAVAKPMRSEAVAGWVRDWRPFDAWTHAHTEPSPRALARLIDEVARRRDDSPPRCEASR